MSGSMSDDLGNTLDREFIEKVVVKMISDKVVAKNEGDFWAMAAEEARSKYNCTRSANAARRIYRDAQSNNKELPNETEYIKRMVRQAEAQDVEAKRDEAEKQKPPALYREAHKTYADPAHQRLQQMAGAALAEIERRESEAKSNAGTGGDK